MKKTLTLLMALVLTINLVACSKSTTKATTENQTIAGTNTTTNTTSSSATATPAAANSAAEALAENSKTHDDETDYIWKDTDVIPITLNDNTITANGTGATIDGSKVTITSAGTYSLSGSLADGQIIVNTEDEGTVRLILNGVELHNSTSAPIYILKAKEVVILLNDGTENIISDAASYVFENAEDDEPNAAIFSKSDLTISGNGSLNVNANYNDAITSKDGLVIASGKITVNAVDDGIRGKDYLVIKNGNIMVDAQGDGLKSDNEENTEKGYISIEAGTIEINAGGDAISAQTDVIISDGGFTLTSGGGSNNIIDEMTSAKGIKASVNINIDGGDFTIDSADDAIHANEHITINSGTFILATGDDGMHADSTLEINGGKIQVTRSYEGIESAVITINDGEIYLTSSDDGLNVAGGNDGSGMMPGMGMEPGTGTNPGMGREPGANMPPDAGGESGVEKNPEMIPGGNRPGRGGGPGQDAFAYAGNYHLYINGGYIVIDAAGDGLDSNGAVDMTNGIVLINGPTQQMNGPLDYMGEFNITGGFLIAAGSSGMAQAPSQTSSQYSVLINLNSTQSAGTIFHVQDSNGEEILTFAPSKEYQSITFSSAELSSGTTYDVFLGGSSSGTTKDNLYQDGTYSPGNSYTSFTISGMVTAIGSGGMHPGRP